MFAECQQEYSFEPDPAAIDLDGFLRPLARRLPGTEPGVPVRIEDEVGSNRHGRWTADNRNKPADRGYYNLFRSLFRSRTAPTGIKRKMSSFSIPDPTGAPPGPKVDASAFAQPV